MDEANPPPQQYTSSLCLAVAGYRFLYADVLFVYDFDDGMHYAGHHLPLYMPPRTIEDTSDCTLGEKHSTHTCTRAREQEQV